MDAEQRRRQRKTRRIVFIVLGVGLVIAGIVLVFRASTPEVTEQDQEVFIGSVAPGQSAVHINQTGFGWVELEGEVLPCSLRIHALTIAQFQEYNATGVIPPGGIECANPTLLVQDSARYVLFVNQGTSELSYQVRATFFLVNSPFAWLLFPSFGLIGVGLVVLGLPWIRGD